MAYCWRCGRPTTVQTGLLPCGPCAEKGLAAMNTTDRLELLRFYRQLEAVPAAQLHDNPGTVEVVPLCPDKVGYNYVYTPLNEDTFIISNHILAETDRLVPFARVLVVQGKVLEVDLVDRNGHFPEQRAELLRQQNLAAQTGAKNRPDPAGNG